MNLFRRHESNKKFMTIPFSEELHLLLKKNGWSDSRCINVNKWLNALRLQNFSVTLTVEMLLSSFGKLTIDPVMNQQSAYKAEPITFDPFLEDSATDDDIHLWESDFSLELCPIGMTEDGIKILISKELQVYGATSDTFFFYGETINDGFETLLLAKRQPKVIS